MKISINSNTDYTKKFAILYFLHYVTGSLVLSQRMTFLIRLGYSITQRSIIFATIPLVSIFISFIISYLSDKYQTIKKLYITTLTISAILAYLFYSVEALIFVYHFIITLFSNSLLSATEELSDIWVLESKGASKNNYGFIRAFGSAGWVLGSFLVARVVLHYGYQGLATTSLLFNVLLLAVVLSIADNKSTTYKSKETISFADIKEIFQNNAYLITILIMFFIRFADAMCGYILIDKILFLGGDEWHIGLRYMIAAGVEIPVLLLGDKFHHKLKSLKMIVIACIAYTLKFFGYYLAQSNNMIFAITILQAIALPFFIVATKYLLLELSPKHLKSTGQIFGPAIINGIQGVLHPLVTALLVSMFTINSPLLLASIMGVTALFLSALLFSEYDKFISIKKDQL